MISQKKVLVTGGHLTPAIAVIEKLLSQREFAITYVGKKQIFKNTPENSWEYQEIKKMDLNFYDFKGGKLQRNFDLSFFKSLFKIPYGLFQALQILRKENPDCIISFGGYIAFPFVLWGKILKIPILAHEQTTKIGLSNKLLSRFADTFCLSWPINLKKIQHKRLKLTGNPLRRAILENSQSIIFKNIKISKPLLYITGGGQGSHFINDLISNILPSLLKNFIIIHQCGESEYNDYAKLESLKESLPQKDRLNYFLYKHIDSTDINWVLRHATLIIGRSGANTITECLYTHLPALFIPLPHSGEGEQKENALMLKNLGVAEIINQNTASTDLLMEKIIYMTKDINKYKSNFTSHTDQLVNLPSSSLIVQEVERLVVE